MLRRVAGYDSGLWFATLSLLCISVYLLMTAIYFNDQVTTFFGTRQAVYAVAGCLLASVITRFDLQSLEGKWPWMYGGMLLAICSVFVLGVTRRGARSWIDLGPIDLQPSEMGKIMLMLALAGFMVARVRDMHRASILALSLVLAAIPAFFVFIQPDLGTAQVYAVIGMSIVFFAGARWLHLAALGGTLLVVIVLAVGVLPAFGVQVLQPHQTQRLTGFLNPESDPQGANYNAIQAKITVGSGGAWGKSATDGSQAQKGFLPEPHTDFIFATLVERHGFAGGAVLLGLFALLVSRCLRAVSVAPSMFGRLICGGVAAMFTWQLLVNVGMTIGVMPITGVTLPLISYGGSSMIANLMAIGLVSNVLCSSEEAGARHARRAPSAHKTLMTLRPNAYGRESTSTGGTARRRSPLARR